MRYFFLFIFILSGAHLLSAQVVHTPKSIKGTQSVCYGSGKVEKSFVPPPGEFLLKSAEKKCDIIVDYVSFPDDAKAAFEYAVGIWETIVESEVPIRMSARWSGNLDDNTLGSCGPETFYTDFKNIPVEGRYYPVAIAEKIAGQELNGESRADIEANFSSKIDWYFGTDGNTPDTTYDFVSVVMHEICHGLGFTGFFWVDDNIGTYGYGSYGFGAVASFDMLVEQFGGNQLIDTAFYTNASRELKDALTSSALYANSPIARSVNSDARPRLYAPGIYNDGSSIYHLNDATYPHGNENSMMTHAIGKGEAVHDPGPLARGIMEDIGWTNLFLRFSPPRDLEEVATVAFSVSIESEYVIDTTSLKLVYSADNFESHSDTLQFETTDKEGVFALLFEPEPGTDMLTYFIEVSDEKGRIRTSPSIAPKKLHKIKFGPDTEKPLISHEPIEYFLLKEKKLLVEADVMDNLGIDTVFVTYAINDVTQTSFGLALVAGSTYSGEFPFDLEALNDGDVITYNIVSKDSSMAINTAIYPEGESLVFIVEKIFEPVSRYVTNFDNASRDFVLSDFGIYTADNFQNGALHSPHPYESPNEDNKDFNFSTFLKYPIIVKEEGTMSFDEVVLVEPGETLSKYGDEDFWDYVIVEGSKDFGDTWQAIANGYDAGANSTWKQNYNAKFVGQDSRTEGSSEWFVNREIPLLESGNFVAGDTVLIRFRLYSDPYANGWGWVIDNLRIQQPVSSPVVEIAPDQIVVFPNPFKNEFKINFNTGTDNSNRSIQVFDLFGKVVFSKDLYNIAQGNMEVINLSGIRSGIYLLNISENGRLLLSKKLIKN